jgi:uncharacterized protein YutE (UPF0331/DUF86 family)
VVKIEVIKQRLNQLCQSIKKIEKYKDLTIDEFLKDEIAQDIIEYNLFISINMITDIAHHIVVDNGLGNPTTLGEAFDILADNDYITREKSQSYRKMVGFRNILSHDYVKINKSLVYNFMKDNLSDLKEFILLVNDKVLN